MAQRAECFIDFHNAYNALRTKVQSELEDLATESVSPAERAVIDLHTIEKELEPEEDVPKICTLLERRGHPSSALEIDLHSYKAALRKAQKAIEECPFHEVHLKPDSINGTGDQDENVWILFTEDDVEIRIEPPHYEDEEDDGYTFEAERLRSDIEHWLLEDCS